MKRPAFQFYPADWQKDPALQSCSIAARGLWIELMCIAHQAEPYGFICVNGGPATSAQLARLVGEQERVVAKLLVELKDAGVYSVDAQGRMFSRRMVKDERLRNVRAEGGRLGGNPALVGGKDNHLDNLSSKQTPTPSSSSSSSSSKSKTLGGSKTPPVVSVGFEEFWRTWPKSDRKQSRGKCFEVWRAKGYEHIAGQIVAHVKAMRLSDDWTKNGGEFIPGPLVYLNQARWEGAEMNGHDNPALEQLRARYGPAVHVTPDGASFTDGSRYWRLDGEPRVAL